MNDKDKIISFLKNTHKIDPESYKGLAFLKRGKSDFFKNNPALSFRNEAFTSYDGQFIY